jgi:hydrogenase maturation protease
VTRILVAGIGNIFFGDDAFGVEVVRELLRREWPVEVRIEDFGIRSYDLAYAIMDGYDAVILVDATPRGLTPGTVSLIEPDLTAVDSAKDEVVNAHSMNPVRVLQMVGSLGGRAQRLYLVGCEPQVLETEEIGLSAAVEAAVLQAAELITSLVRALGEGTADDIVENATSKGIHAKTS